MGDAIQDGAVYYFDDIDRFRRIEIASFFKANGREYFPDQWSVACCYDAMHNLYNAIYHAHVLLGEIAFKQGAPHDALISVDNRGRLSVEVLANEPPLSLDYKDAYSIDLDPCSESFRFPWREDFQVASESLFVDWYSVHLDASVAREYFDSLGNNGVPLVEI